MSRGARRILGAWASDVGASLLARAPVRRSARPTRGSAIVVELSRLGDAIQAYAVAVHLRRSRRFDSVALAVDSAYAALFEGQGGIDRVVGVPRGGRRIRDLVALARSGGDAIVNVSPSIRNTLVVFASDAATRVGYFDWTSPLTPFRDRLDVVLRGASGAAWRTVPPGTPLAMRAAAVLELLDAPSIVATARLVPSPASVARVRDELAETATQPSGGIAVLHPGATWRFRGWPTDRWIALGRSLVASHAARIVVLGNRAETATVGAIRHGLGAPATAWVSRPLPEVAALLASASVFVGGDSGPLHFACAVGTPAVGLFGPASPVLTAPLGFEGIALDPGYPCSPCDQHRCVRPTEPCIHSHTVTSVARAASQVWRSVSRG